MISALISASVAIFIFTLGLFIRARTERTALLMTKLEDYFRSLEQVSKLAKLPSIAENITTGAFWQRHIDHSIEINNSLEQPKILANLYFKDTLPRFKKMENTVESYTNWMINYGYPDEHSNKETSSPEEREKIHDELITSMYELRQYMIDESDELTARWWLLRYFD